MAARPDSFLPLRLEMPAVPAASRLSLGADPPYARRKSVARYNPGGALRHGYPVRAFVLP
jgi:hypothetical protein